MVQHVGVVRRDQQGRGPLEPVLPLRRRVTVGAVGPRTDEPEGVGLVVHPAQEPRVVPAVGDVGIVGPGLDVARLTGHVVPLPAVDSTGPAAGPAHPGIVLLGAAHAVREVVRGLDVIELRRRHVLVGPGLASVEGDIGTAIVRFDQTIGVVGRDPQVVIVAMRIDHVAERDPAVRGLEEVDLRRPHGVRILGVGKDLRVVPGPLPQLVVRVHVLPGGAAVVRPVHAARVRLDERPHPRRLGWRDRDPDVAPQPGGETRILGDFGPVLGCVGGLEQPAPRPARHQRPGPAHRLP